jgi:hypothetical protein
MPERPDPQHFPVLVHAIGAADVVHGFPVKLAGHPLSADFEVLAPDPLGEDGQRLRLAAQDARSDGRGIFMISAATYRARLSRLAVAFVLAALASESGKAMQCSF